MKQSKTYGVQIKTSPENDYSWYRGWDMSHSTLESARESRKRAAQQFHAARIIEIETGRVVKH